MKNMFVRPLTLLLTAALLVLGLDLATYAATGDSLVLGRVNKATKLTTLTRTTNGPVLALRGKASSPPLTVSSGRKVARLNADKLDGLDAAALQTRVTTYDLAPPASPTSLLLWDIPWAPGTYLVNWSAQLNGSTGTIICGFHNAGFTNVPTAQMVDSTSSLILDALSGSGRVTTSAAEPYEFFCQSTAGNLSLFGDGITVTVQRPAASPVTPVSPRVRAGGGARLQW
jgi:hypothetical protein